LEVKYIPGKDNIIADALSRWAYPASSAREDVSFHGSIKAKEDVREMVKREKEDNAHASQQWFDNQRLGEGVQLLADNMGSSPVSPTIPILVTTRSGAGRADSGSEASSQVGNPPQSSTGLNVPNPEMLLEATTEGRRKSPRLAELEKRTAIPGTALDATHAEPESRSEPRPESKQKLPVGIVPALTPRDTDTLQRASIEAQPGTGASHGQPDSPQRDYPLVNGRGVTDEAEQATPVIPLNPPRLGQLLDRARALQGTPRNTVEEEEGANSDASLDPYLSHREPDHVDLLEGGMGPEWYDDVVSLTTVMAIPLSAEQWEEAKGRGVLSGVDGKIHGFDPELSFPPRWVKRNSLFFFALVSLRAN
jgi:hypothetical protein